MTTTCKLIASRLETQNLFTVGDYQIESLDAVVDTVKVGSEYFEMRYLQPKGVSHRDCQFSQQGGGNFTIEELEARCRQSQPIVTKLVTRDIDVDLNLFK